MLDSNLSWGGVLDFVDISMMVQIADPSQSYQI